MSADFPQQQGVSLSVRGLRKSYNGVEVLKGINFEVKAGEVFVIMGPSGAGKSVLLRQLIGLEMPDRGQVLIEGQPILSPDVTNRYRVAMVFQSGALLTSLEDGRIIAIGTREEIRNNPDPRVQKFINARIPQAPDETAKLPAAATISI